MRSYIIDDNYKLEEKVFSIIATFLNSGVFDKETGTLELCDMILSYDEYQEYVLVDENGKIIFIFDGIVKCLTIEDVKIIDSIIEIIVYDEMVKEKENV